MQKQFLSGALLRKIVSFFFEDFQPTFSSYENVIVFFDRHAKKSAILSDKKLFNFKTFEILKKINFRYKNRIFDFLFLIAEFYDFYSYVFLKF